METMDISTVPTVATDLLDFQSDYLWALVVGFHLSFLFAAAMGANEVSNAFASSVGSGAISLRVAYVLATVVESAGGILLGYKVLETLRFKIIDLDMYEQKPAELLLGQVAILGGSALWMAGATLCLLPVSSTHSHIGAIVGFSLLMRGPRGLHLRELLKIVVSWVVSPLLSGIVSALLYVLFDFAVFRRNDPLKSGFRAMPIFYFCVFTFNTFMIVYQGSKWLGFDRTPLWLAAVCSIGIGLLAALIFQFFIRKRLLKWVRRQEELRQKKEGVTEAVEAAEEETRFSSSNGRNRTSRLRSILPDPNRKADPQTLQLFSAIQVFTGCFTGFSHGSKDIPNTIAPLATLLFVFSHLRVPLGQPQETPLWFLAYGALATCIGFWLLGHKVIRTVGHKFTVLSPFSGFCVELGAALTVLCASKLGIPVSMTLCVVGSVVAVGAVRGSEPVNWALFRNVFIAWLLTFPLSALFSATLMFLLKMVFL